MQAVFTTAAERDLRQLDHTIASRVMRKILWLAADGESISHEPLSWQWRGFYKLRVGDWRIIYQLDYAREQLIVEFVGHRSRVYKQ